MRKRIEMHPTMVNLYFAARDLKGVGSPTEVAALLNESPQLLNNWERRGMSKGGIIKAASILGCSVDFLANGSVDAISDGQRPWKSLAVPELREDESRVNPYSIGTEQPVQNRFSQETKRLINELEAAERSGWLSPKVIRALRQVLQLAEPSAKEGVRHTEIHTVAEGTEGQTHEQQGRSRRQRS